MTQRNLPIHLIVCTWHVDLKGSCSVTTPVSTVFASQWDAKKMRVMSHPEKNTLNSKLSDLAAIAREFEDTLPLTEKPTQEKFKYFFWVKLKRIEEGRTFFAVVDVVLENLPTRENRNHEVICARSVRKYQIVSGALHKFEMDKRKEQKGVQLDFKTFDERLIKEFDCIFRKKGYG